MQGDSKRNSNRNLKFSLSNFSTIPGRSWTQIAGGLVQVASGAEVWGVNSGDAIWKYLGNNKWQNMPGRLTNVSENDHDS